MIIQTTGGPDTTLSKRKVGFNRDKRRTNLLENIFLRVSNDVPARTGKIMVWY
jgi:hypothetical protein